MEILAYVCGFAAVAAIVAMGVAGLNGRGDWGVWLACFAVVLAAISISLWATSDRRNAGAVNDAQAAAQKQRHPDGAPEGGTVAKLPIEPPKESRNAATGNDPADKERGGIVKPTSDWPPRFYLGAELVFTAGLLIFAIGQVIYGYRQWSSMRDQNEIMQTQTTQIGDQIKLGREQLQTGKDSADAAKRSADAAMQTVEEMRNEQRPWISIQVPIKETSADGTKTRIKLIVTNVGKSPATIRGRGTDLSGAKPDFDVKGIRDGNPEATLDSADEILKSLREPPEFHDCEIVIVPDDPIAIAMEERDTTYIEARGTAQVLFYYVAYTDMSGGKHETWTCFVYAPEVGTWVRNTRYHGMN